MSTRPAATRTLFRRWVDDAAVFPPRTAPVEQAWAEHLELRSGRYADLLGPLLVGAPGAASLVAAAAAAPPPGGLAPVGVAVIARAGVPVADLLTAVQSVSDSPHLEVAGVEVAHDTEGTWRRALEPGVRVAVEVPPDAEAMVAALDDVAAAAAEQQQPPVIAKLRTQSTADRPAPGARQLAEFLAAARQRGLAVKLTGGLHHTVADAERADHPHGALNVLVATHHLLEGAGLRSLAATLEVGDADALAALTAGLSEEAATAVRKQLVSFGCCDVTDPLSGLEELGLIHEES